MRPIRILTAALLILSLTACSREITKAAGDTHASKEAAERKKPGAIVLTPEAQKTGGIEVQPVGSSSVNEVIAATGELTVNEDQTWSVGSLLDGRVVAVSAKVGDFVKAGQVLARIHSHDVHDARASFKAAELELARTQAAEAYAQRLRDRAKRLFDIKAASQMEVDNAEAELRNASAAVRNAKVNVEKERTHIVEFLEVPIEDDDSKRDLSDYVPVKAPSSGLVIERKVTQGTVVATGETMFRITATGSLWMIARVNEADLGQLRPGQSVRVLVRAYSGRAFSGRILQLGEQLDPTTRTLQVRVLVPNPGNVLKPEMFATAEIARPAARPALFVPDSAIQDLNGARVVFVLTGLNQFEPRAIEVSRPSGGTYEVTSGLQPGDRIAVKGSFVLKSEILRRSLSEITPE